ncbi:PAS domain S-box protein [Aequorivita sp. F47161]|uniref:histidine kinase n=1 Tax=Aequorivita vitellina TaxID=2874475 RepID=A0A9X1QUY9_9FLAO|nr:PAS domain S-box protein [Aequorivita vitellina]MCG2418830.1 PAS domain S-box protein [Aequorivita vitellina]
MAVHKLTKSIKNRYLLFLCTIIIIIATVLFIIQRSINIQSANTQLVQIADNQSFLLQNMLATKVVSDIRQSSEGISANVEELKQLTSQFEKSQKQLELQANASFINAKSDSLIKVSSPIANRILIAANAIVESNEPPRIKNLYTEIQNLEPQYSLIINRVTKNHLAGEEEGLLNLRHTMYVFAVVSILILLGEYFFILIPTLNQLFKKNRQLTQTNTDLAISESKIMANMRELEKLKLDLETQEEYNKIFIEQAPTAIAMLDSDMKYIAVSQQWIKDYKMQGQQVIGRSHYDIFPEIGDEWKANHQKCLQGAIDTCDEAPFKRADGSIQWIYWDVRPWYISKDKIGGLLMHTGDITASKERDLEKHRIQKILDKTNEVARIGTWEVDFQKQKVFWSKVVYDLHNVPYGTQIDIETAINYYKKGKSRDTINKAINEALTQGIPYDVEVELVTENGTEIWARVIGQPEYQDNECIGILGVFQDITSFKVAQLALNKAHNELKAVLNSGPISIVSSNRDGLINHFNYGAEKMLGYSADEVIGIKSPEIFHIQEEMEQFSLDMAAKLNKDPEGFDPYGALFELNINDTREWTYRRKDGSTFPVLLTVTAIKDEEGKSLGLLGMALDITERKKAENELLKKNYLLNFAEEITMIGHWQWDVVADKVLWSNNLFKMFDLDENTVDLKFDSYFNFVHPDDKELVAEYFQKAKTDKVFYKFSHRIITAKGVQKTIQLLGEVFTNDKGEVVEMIGTGQDITEQKMAENKFRGLLESAPDAMVIVDEKGNIQLINKQAERLFGYHIDELFDKPVEVLIPKRYKSANNHTNQRNTFFEKPKARSMGAGKTDVLYGIDKDGNEIPVQISLSPLRTEEGLLVSAAIRDITQQLKAERKIIRAKENLEVLTQHLSAQNKQLADFAQITSHNLRAPVSNLNALLHLYEISESVTEKEELFEKFETVIEHLTSTLNTLIEALKTRTVSKKDLKEVFFKNTLDKTREILSGQIINTNAKITTDFSEVPKIKYHKTYLESILLNLVSNAIKYRSPNRNPVIHIKTEIVDNKINLSVTDNGLGIDLKKHGHKLFGLNKTFHRHPDAKGVGLYLTKIQVETMGGTIFASSKLNEGTVFTVIFNSSNNE